MGRPRYQVTIQDKNQVANWISSITPDIDAAYIDYWTLIKPDNVIAKFWRWMFAYVTVNSGWEASVRAFNAVKALSTQFTETQLREALKASNTGMYNKRAEAIPRFRDMFFRDTTVFDKQTYKTMLECRDTLVKLLRGTHIGIAKVSLALSMIYPEQTEVLCLDRWINRMYGIPAHLMNAQAASSYAHYRELEKHFIVTCQIYGLHPTMVREMFWDHIHGYGFYGTRYWSHIFENEHVAKLLGPATYQGNQRQSTRNSKQQKVQHILTASYSQAKVAQAIHQDFIDKMRTANAKIAVENAMSSGQPRQGSGNIIVST